MNNLKTRTDCINKTVDEIKEISFICKEKLELYKIARFSIKLVPWVFFFLLIIFTVICITLGIFWQSPNKRLSINPHNITKHSINLTNNSIKPSFCSIESNGFDLIQISSLPVLMYFMNCKRNSTKELNQIQRDNIDAFLSTVFRQESRDLEYYNIGIWGYSIRKVTNNVTLQVYGGIRSPLDYGMIMEISIESWIYTILSSMFPFITIIQSQVVRCFNIIFDLLQYIGFGFTSYKMAYLVDQDYKNATILVGQGLGGFFAQNIIKMRNLSIQTFTFDSIQYPLDGVNSSIKYHVQNYYQKGIHIDYDDSIIHNIRHPSHSGVVSFPSAYESFCNIAAQCSDDTNIHDYCFFLVGENYSQYLSTYDR